MAIGDEKVKADHESEWRGRVEDKNIGAEVRELSRQDTGSVLSMKIEITKNYDRSHS